MMKFKKVLSVMALATWMVVLVGCGKPVEPVPGGNGGNIVIPVLLHEYVDLGLPSGTLWAACNVGADSPEDFGKYFAWGETRAKDVYDWKSYQYGTLYQGCFAMTKYCTDSCYGLHGFVDHLTFLEPQDDAVQAQWGVKWRMPTKEEWEELLQNTTISSATLNGVQGRRLTGLNGNSIFLPASGFWLDDKLLCVGMGAYWSSTLHSDYPERGWSFHFDVDNCHVCGTYERNRGQSARGVLKK